jgi:drug/metabolite transporter (DMT)-like permease
MKLSRTQLAILCLIAANIIWGAASPIFKWTLQSVDPFTFAFIRFFFSALIIFPFVHKKLAIKHKDIYILVFMAVVGLAFKIGYSFYGLRFAPSINDLIISSTAPVFLFIGAVALFHEKLRKKVAFGMLLSFLGVMVIILQPLLTEGLDLSFMGNIFFVISMSLNVLYMLLLKELAPKYSILTLLFWTFAVAAITLFPFASVEMARNNIFTTMNTQGLVGISFAVIFSTILAYILNSYGVRYLQASEVGIFSYVDPFAGFAIAQPLLGEHLTPHFLIGVVMVFLGILIAENRLHYHPFHLLKPKPLPAEEKVPVLIE